MKRHGIKAVDRDLACAPINSPEGRSYYAAMACAANTAFVNRQVITHRIREGFSRAFGKSDIDLGMDLVYDVAHNIAKFEKYEIKGQKKELLVHRKGATRSFGPGEEQLPEAYRSVGQPVIVGGSMETGSYLLVGTRRAMELTFGSTIHGSGRTMSRSKAKKLARGQEVKKRLQDQGIEIRAASLGGLAEEVGFAYKDINEVVDTVHRTGISNRVARLIPIGNIKG
jgi:tRNA-splicing ligase RtcB